MLSYSTEAATNIMHFTSSTTVSLHSTARPSCCIAFTTLPSIAARNIHFIIAGKGCKIACTFAVSSVVD